MLGKQATPTARMIETYDSEVINVGCAKRNSNENFEIKTDPVKRKTYCNIFFTSLVSCL